MRSGGLNLSCTALQLGPEYGLGISDMSGVRRCCVSRKALPMDYSYPNLAEILEVLLGFVHVRSWLIFSSLFSIPFVGRSRHPDILQKPLLVVYIHCKQCWLSSMCSLYIVFLSFTHVLYTHSIPLPLLGPSSSSSLLVSFFPPVINCIFK